MTTNVHLRDYVSPKDKLLAEVAAVPITEFNPDYRALYLTLEASSNAEAAWLAFRNQESAAISRDYLKRTAAYALAAVLAMDAASTGEKA